MPDDLVLGREGWHVLAFLHLKPGIEDPRRLELLDHLLVLDPRVFLLLVEQQEFLPRCRHVLVGGEYRDECAEAQVAHDHQVAADQVEEERRQLPDEVVEELDDELAVEDLVADQVDSAENLGKGRPIVAGAVVDPDLLHAGNRLADVLRQPAHHAHPVLGEQVDLALHARDQPALEWVEGHGGQAEDRILNENEEEDREELPGLEDRLGDGVADEAADGFHLRRDHRNDLALAHSLEMRQREAQHAAVEFVPQAAQHALA